MTRRRLGTAALAAVAAAALLSGPTGMAAAAGGRPAAAAQQRVGSERPAAHRATPAAASPAALVYGIAQEGDGYFLEDPQFTALKVHQVRLILPYNVMDARSSACVNERSRLQQVYDDARARGVHVMVSFQFRCKGDTWYDDPKHPKPTDNHLHKPSVSTYRYWVKRFHQAYSAVRAIAAWNEPNNRSQPTHDAPRLAAAYAVAVQEVLRASGCTNDKHPCRVLAGEFVDSGKSKHYKSWYSYANAYRKALNAVSEDHHVPVPSTWAFHPYTDVKKQQRTDTKKFLVNISRGKPVWFTEVGSRVDSFGSDGPRNDMSGQRDEVHFLVTKLSTMRPSIKRLYYYALCVPKPSFDPDATFDSGLLGPANSGDPQGGYDCASKQPRLAYTEYQKWTTRTGEAASASLTPAARGAGCRAR